VEPVSGYLRDLQLSDASAWPVLHDMGLIPAWAPRTLQDARIRGRRSVEDLVDRHKLRNREIRDLMVEYLRRRSAEVDYATTENLVRCLVEGIDLTLSYLHGKRAQAQRAAAASPVSLGMPVVRGR
jgi:hypothetical protein